MIELGIDSFAAVKTEESRTRAHNSMESLEELLERIVRADESGLHLFGFGEHHREEYLDSANTIIMAAAAARTRQIRLVSAVTVLSAADPVRVYQQFATLDLISKGRVEMVAGRGSFIDAFPLFGLDMKDYDELFTEKMELFLKIQKEGRITWSGKFRPAMNDQPVYPRSFQNPIPVWLGVGGTPASFVRAGKMGLPLMVAVIGGETHRFRPLVDMYRNAWLQAGHPESEMKVGLHSLGYVADTTHNAIEEFYPGYAESFTKIGQERGWPPVTRSRFDPLVREKGALLVGDASTVAEKILRHSEALGGINRVTFQMDSALLSHEQMLRSIELIGKEVISLVNRD
ncbi:LLM class flavin-dependent oxidoreductase [Alkalitalea saponilacus]|uniref:Probable oxidoreductase, LLM family n=1 Tax=Alkalitalea saponilacus TaxID=889453 RepID=A0A1T5HMY3_9BACT|nr:LLM class flavin-dependent oxidoreductase [Alkalitalea saponilacus]SKC22043.1 probable oxidoreductase, LLM family [Alkalitalea saponilacus]